MENYNEQFIKKKKLLMQMNSGELNKSLLYYINEARTSPRDFARHLMVDDDVDEQISKLSLFFKYSSEPVHPLELDPNLELSSNDLLYHIISNDDGSSELNFSKKDKEGNNLKERLKKINLIPVYHIDLLIIGAQNAIEALANILLNKNHRKKILSKEMNYIGISSGFLPSERLCFVIDIVNSFKTYNNYFRTKDINYINSIDNSTRQSKENYIRFTNVQSDEENGDENIENVYNENSGEEDYPKYTKNPYCTKTYFNRKYNKNKSKNIKNFISAERYRPFVGEKNKLNFNEENVNLKENKKNKYIDLTVSRTKWFSPTTRKSTNNRVYNDCPQKYKYPMSVSIEKKYRKNRYGEVFPIWNRKIIYDDGSILLQPYN